MIPSVPEVADDHDDDGDNHEHEDEMQIEPEVNDNEDEDEEIGNEEISKWMEILEAKNLEVEYQQQLCLLCCRDYGSSSKVKLLCVSNNIFFEKFQKTVEDKFKEIQRSSSSSSRRPRPQESNESENGDFRNSTVCSICFARMFRAQRAESVMQQLEVQVGYLQKQLLELLTGMAAKSEEFAVEMEKIGRAVSKLSNNEEETKISEFRKKIGDVVNDLNEFNGKLRRKIGKENLPMKNPKHRYRHVVTPRSALPKEVNVTPAPSPPTPTVKTEPEDSPEDLDDFADPENQNNLEETPDLEEEPATSSSTSIIIKGKSAACPTASDPLTCEICGKPGWKVEANLKQHRLTHMNTEERIKASTDTRRICPTCGLVLCNSVSLRQHQRTHLNKEDRDKLLRQCHLCPNRYASQSTLRSHIKQMHENAGVRKYQCIACKNRFRSPFNLKLHHRKHCRFKTNSSN